MMSRALAYAALILFAGAATVGAQGTAADDVAKVKAPSLADFYRIDVDLPDVPAATAIGVDPTKAGTPGTTRALAMAFSDFTDGDGKFQLPKSFAVEFAPRLVFFGRGLNVTEFARTLPLSTLRFSAATARVDDATGATRIAGGVRTNFLDMGDPRANKRFQNDVSALMLRWSERYAALREYVMGDVTVTDAEEFLRPKSATTPNGVSAKSAPALPEPTATITCVVPRARATGTASADTVGCVSRPAIAAKATPKVDTTLVKLQRAVTATHDSLVAMKKAFDEQGWNAARIEAAYAIGGSTRDAQGKSPHVVSHAAWAGASAPLSRFGAANLVARYERVRDTTTTGAPLTGQGVAAGRLLVGSARARAFGEYQYTRRSGEIGRVWAGGGEVRLVEDVWLRLSTGVTQPVGEAKGRLVTQFKIQVAPRAAEPDVGSGTQKSSGNAAKSDGKPS